MKKLLQRPWFGPLLALIGVYALFAFLRPETFLGGANLELMTRQTVVVALAAVGMTVVMMQGGIDLSVGSVVALSTVVLAKALQAGLSTPMATLLAVATGCICGLINGALVAGLRITPFIVTLGTMSVLRGLAKGLANEQKIDAEAQGLDRWMSSMEGDLDMLVLAPGVWLCILVALATALLLYRSVLGRHIVAVGSNEKTARLCGVSIFRVTVVVYLVMGFTAGLAGAMEFATLTVGDPTDSIGLELSVIAAVVIGGGSLSGGQGSIAGSLIGALLMTVIRTGCTHMGLPNWVQEILTGAIIVVAVFLDRLRRER